MGDYISSERYEADQKRHEEQMRDLKQMQEMQDQNFKHIMELQTQRYDAMMQANIEYHKRISEEIRSEFRESNARLEGRMNALENKVEGFADTFTVAISDLRDSMNRGFTIIGIGFAALTVLITIGMFVVPFLTK